MIQTGSRIRKSILLNLRNGIKKDYTKDWYNGITFIVPADTWKGLHSLFISKTGYPSFFVFAI